MKKSPFKQLALSPFRLLLLLALLISSTHIAKGEILEYTANFDQESIDYTQELWNGDREWLTMGTINLNKGEELRVLKGGIIREVNSKPNPPSNWDRYDMKLPHIRFTFKHKFLNEEIEVRYLYFLETQSNKAIYINGVLLNSGINNNDYYNDLVKKNLLIGPSEIKVDICKFKQYVTLRSNSSTKKIHTPRQVITAKLEKTSTASSNAQSTANKNILVLPKGTGTNELILESSEDLITWEKDVPGDKSTDNGNRFYRLRAVKK